MKRIHGLGRVMLAILTFPYGIVKAYKYAMKCINGVPGHINYLWE